MTKNALEPEVIAAIRQARGEGWKPMPQFRTDWARTRDLEARWLEGEDLDFKDL